MTAEAQGHPVGRFEIRSRVGVGRARGDLMGCGYGRAERVIGHPSAIAVLLRAQQ